MKKIIHMTLSNFTATILFILFAAYMKSISGQAGLGAVVPALIGLLALVLYLIIYGIITYVKTKQIIAPNIDLFAFIIIGFLVYITVTKLSLDSIFEYIIVPIVVLSFSLIPSLIAKFITTFREKKKIKPHSEE